MNKKILYSALLGIPFMIAFIILSNSIKTTEYIWLQTRVFGLIAFFALFLTVVIGELRLLSKIKANFVLFKYHVPIAIFSTVIVLMHFISAVFDKFKWGKTLAFTQFLGFSFSDKWVVLLSLGTLAFYFMLIVGITSSKGMIQRIGYKKWKLIHYFSYVAFLFAYIHSINLGTDIKSVEVGFILKPIFIIMFIFVLALLITRILNAYKLFSDQIEINIAAVFFILLLLGSVFIIKAYVEGTEKLTELSNSVTATNTDINSIQIENQNLLDQGLLLNQQIGLLLTSATR
ncbi:hypothetical protein COV13_04130 [Candidatus Woesearchaeota archaeon CG10_big_fil_rev_8_21_14_0_10_32_9]|nr:MAG: hypothetical protein COV13_04130 [Candidatus Woesearchaeota archaeon CG10_big_fil_rev_8_21_14_0_10_32_9]